MDGEPYILSNKKKGEQKENDIVEKIEIEI